MAIGINMRRWVALTKSSTYSEWHPDALRVCEIAGTKPIKDEHTYTYHHIFLYQVKNPKNSRNHQRLLEIGLTEDGELELLHWADDKSKYPAWYMNQAMEKMVLLYEAFDCCDFIERWKNGN